MSKYAPIYDALIEKTKLTLRRLRDQREAALQEASKLLKGRKLMHEGKRQRYYTLSTLKISLPVCMTLRYADHDNVYATAIETDITLEEGNRVLRGEQIDEVLGSQKDERFRHYLYTIPLNGMVCEGGSQVKSEITKRRISSDQIYFGKEIVCNAEEYRETETQIFYPSYAKCGEWYLDKHGKLCPGDDLSAGMTSHIVHDGCEPYLVEIAVTEYMEENVVELTHLWTDVKRSYLLPKDREIMYESFIIVDGELFYHHGDSLYRGDNNEITMSGFVVIDETMDAESWEIAEGIVPTTYFISNGESICQRQDRKLHISSLYECNYSESSSSSGEATEMNSSCDSVPDVSSPSDDSTPDRLDEITEDLKGTIFSLATSIIEGIEALHTDDESGEEENEDE